MNKLHKLHSTVEIRNESDHEKKRLCQCKNKEATTDELMPHEILTLSLAFSLFVARDSLSKTLSPLLCISNAYRASYQLKTINCKNR